MHALKSLFSQRDLRCFALLDAHGVCRGLRQSQVRPSGSCWVEVCEYRLAWLQRPLPQDARVS